MKRALISATCGTTEEVAEKSVVDAKSVPQALKRGYIFNDLTARLKSCPSRSRAGRGSSVGSEIVPFPILRRRGFFPQPLNSCCSRSRFFPAFPGRRWILGAHHDE